MHNPEHVIKAADAVIFQLSTPFWKHDASTKNCVEALKRAIDAEKRYLKHCTRFNDLTSEINL